MMFESPLRILTVAVFVGSFVSGVDIKESRKNAIEKVENEMRNLKRITNETLTNLPQKQINLGFITKHVTNAGNNMFESSNSQIRSVAISASIFRVLLKGSDQVQKCIDRDENNTFENARRYYEHKFLDACYETEKEAEDAQSQGVKNWIDEYNNSIMQFTEIYERTIDDIQKSDDENEMTRFVYDFSRNCREMEKIVMKIDPYLDRLQLQYLRILENSLFSVMHSFRASVDDLIRRVKNCFGGLPLSHDEIIESNAFPSYQ